MRGPLTYRRHRSTHRRPPAAPAASTPDPTVDDEATRAVEVTISCPYCSSDAVVIANVPIVAATAIQPSLAYRCRQGCELPASLAQQFYSALSRRAIA